MMESDNQDQSERKNLLKDRRVSMNDLGFPLHEYTRLELIDLAIQLFEEFGLIDVLKTDKATLRALFGEVARRYLRGPYHHFTHAFYLLHLSQWICKQINWQEHLTPLDVASMFLAALAHDVNHPSTNNAYQNRIQTNASQVYYGKSVLENHHISIFFQIMKMHPETDVLANLEAKDKAYVKQVIIDSVLKTDMAIHFKLQKEFSQFVDTHCSGETPYNKDSEQDRQHLVAIIIHACDIGTSALPFDLFDQWGARCIQEFHEQYESEEQDEHGPATVFMKYNGKAPYYKSQVGFLNAMVVPMWKDLHRLLPGIEEAWNNMTSNIEKLGQIGEGK